ncbi:fatty-acid-binding protein 3, chloroplastic isoform X2 [Dendrobium catenatum]|uniref:fatty-acid-binding protein 3, chloroplastic isoform X2 n=1 Tax=Dendrobium catenatum TaxID=906689 RepID=UPI0009F20287|nr:fatty-acid-binding protein 3, chloroplastic isoform X2 [Dendrobium catenatum]
MAAAVSYASSWALQLRFANIPNHSGSPLVKLSPNFSSNLRRLSLPFLSCNPTKFRHPLPPKASGFREKTFAIIGVKVYAAGFYTKSSIKLTLDALKGKPAGTVLEDSSLFKSVYQAPLDKSLWIILVRHVDGQTFWNALNDVISPRIKKPTAVDESALSTFRNTFQGRDLMQGTSIFLTWTQHSNMLVSISSDGFPTEVDAKIESPNVTLALFDAFFGDSPVSPTLKVSVADGLAKYLS